MSPDKIYFKATQPNGTDFYTGKVQYAVGRRVRPLPIPQVAERRICGPGFLHASDVPAETLLRGSWPCRLFEVTGAPAVGFDQYHRHKGGFRQLMVVREIDAHLAFGPNGRYVAAVIERTRKLTRDEIYSLSARYVSGRDAHMPRLSNVARDAARYAAWEAAGYTARHTTRKYAVGYATRAGQVAGQAAMALVVRDLITSARFDALYRPWRKVIGEPTPEQLAQH